LGQKTFASNTPEVKKRIPENVGSYYFKKETIIHLNPALKTSPS
jgi:hypothetical protein